MRVGVIALRREAVGRWRVLFTRSGDLVERLQVARRELGLESTIATLDTYHLITLDSTLVSA